MEFTVTTIAEHYNASRRSVQQAITDGHLSPLRTLSNIYILDDIAVNAWDRSRARGRFWSEHIKNTALDLLSSGQTDEKLTSAELSRLKKRLTTMDATHIAHCAGGLGTWARYRISTKITLTPVGPDSTTAAELDLISGNYWVSFAQVPDLAELEWNNEIFRDPDGNLGVVERPTEDTRSARNLIDAYLLGDARMSALAAEELEERTHAL